MAGINYTPLAHLSDEELLNEVYRKEGVTDHELELAERLDRALVVISTYEESLLPKPVLTKYKEAA